MLDQYFSIFIQTSTVAIRWKTVLHSYQFYGFYELNQKGAVITQTSHVSTLFMDAREMLTLNRIKYLLVLFQKLNNLPLWICIYTYMCNTIEIQIIVLEWQMVHQNLDIRNRNWTSELAPKDTKKREPFQVWNECVMIPKMHLGHNYH